MTISSRPAQTMEDQHLLFDTFRDPCCQEEADSVTDNEDVKLFTDCIESGLEFLGRSFAEFSPKVLINAKTDEIGIGFLQIKVKNPSGSHSIKKLEKAIDDHGADVFAFVSKSGVSCQVPGHATLCFEPGSVPAIASIFLAALLAKQPVCFPECPCCAAEAE